MLAEVVVPGWVLRPPPLGRDDRHPIAVVEVERGIPAPPPRPRASRLEERCGNRACGAEPTLRELQQMWVELPGDVNGKPKSCLGGGQPAYREIQATASLIRIHVAQNGRSLPTARLRDSPAGGEKQLGLLSPAFSEDLHGRLATLAAEHELGDVRERLRPTRRVRGGSPVAGRWRKAPFAADA